MGNSILHPRADELVSYQFSSDLESRKRMESHLNECDSCTQTLSELNALRKYLVESPDFESLPVGSGHLTDEMIIAYVASFKKGDIPDDKNAYTQSHISNCGQCMKAVLRYRAHKASLLNTQAGIASESAICQDKTRPAMVRSWWNIVSGIGRRRIPFWTTVPIAALASIIVAIIVPLKATVDVGDGLGTIQRIEYVQNQSVPSDALLRVGTLKQNLINWYDGYAETTAIGTADMSKAVNAIQAELLAKKAAKHIAYANLSETINGLSINAKTTYRDLITDVDALQTESQGFIRGGRVVSETIEWIRGEPKAIVTVRIPLFGNKGVQGLVERAAVKQEKVGDSASRGEATTASMLDEYDGVVIDARGVQYSPALQVSIVSVDNEEIYKASTGLVSVNSDATAVRYYASVQTAVDSLLFGGNPMVVKASESPGSGVLVVSQEDASALFQLKQVVNEYQRRNRVAVVF